MSSKLKEVRGDDGVLHGYSFYCPGCEDNHVFFLAGTLTWNFDGNLDEPSFTPSLLNTCETHPDPRQRRCHLVMTKGMIAYGTDCSHSLAGHTIPLCPRPA